MEECRDQFKKLLARANRDKQFLKQICDGNQNAWNLYNLDEKEINKLKLYKTREDILSDFETCYNLTAFFALINRRFPINFFSGEYVHTSRYLVAFFLTIFLVIYGYFPNLFTEVGIPSWGSLQPVTKLSMILLILAYFVLAFTFLGRRVEDLDGPEKISFRIILVLFVIPTVIVLRNILTNATYQDVLVKLILATFFTCLPASFYILFIRNKRQSNWEEFASNLKRLDPKGHEKLKVIYWKKFVSLYGKPEQNDQSSSFFDEERAIPIYLCLVIIGIGWLLFLFPSAPPINAPSSRTWLPFGLVGIFSTFTFGYLGAYFFVIQMLFRRYVQADLKPTAYSHASKRILTTWIWAFVLYAVQESNPVLNFSENPALNFSEKIPEFAIVAFVIGIFPEIGWKVVSSSLKAGLSTFMPSFREQHPLDKIDGITVWMQTRLLEEDIENVQNLVTTNIFDLMLRTNLHPGRIINWIDEGTLYLHTSKDKSGKLSNSLKEYGIITASDLIFSYKAFKKSHDDEYFIDRESDKKIERLLEVLKKTSNMYHVLAWHNTQGMLIERPASSINSQNHLWSGEITDIGPHQLDGEAKTEHLQVVTG
jgi:hypothetical protein